MSAAPKLVDAIDRRFGAADSPRRIGIAVSGGSDSLALLHLLADWGRGTLLAATVDHGLRPEASEEAAYVARFCEGLGIPHRTLKWQGWDGRGNLQDHARRNRYALLAGWAKSNTLETVCLGHTLDDQAETFVMRLAREAGIDGLSGMAQLFWRDDMRFDRPLLWERRAALRGYLEEKGVRWIDDPSNEDESFSRIKARKALAALEPLGIDAKVIGGSITNLDMARLALADYTSEVAAKTVKVVEGDLIIDRTALRRQSPEIIRRILSAGLRWVAAEDYPPRRESLADAEVAIFVGRNTTLHGCMILTSDLTIRLTRELKAVARLASPSDQSWDGRWRLDGPHAPGLEIRALGEAVKDCPNWRDTGLPRASLLASPAVWRGDTLVAAPLAGLENGWRASATGRGTFAQFLLSR